MKTLLKNATGELSSIKQEVKELSGIHAQLLKVEAAEVTTYIKKKVIAGVLLAFFAFFLFCILLTAFISWLGIILEPKFSESLQPFSWHIVAATISLIFLTIIGICMASLKAKPKEEFFSLTKQELKNDKVWLQNLTRQGSKNS